MSFDRVSDVYDETRIIPKGVLSRFYMKTIANGTVLNRNSVVLDAGVGTGRTVGPLLDMGVQLVGIDISKKMLRRMIKKLKGISASDRVSLILGDVTSLPFREDSFDLIFSVHVLHLVRKWRKAIGESKRVLKSNGFFVAATHGAPDLISKVGQKYFTLCNKYGIPKAKGLRQLVSQIVNKIFYDQKMRFLERFLRIILEHNSFLGVGGETYLRRQAASTRQIIVKWKETRNINEIYDRLNNRIISKQWRIPTDIHQKVMSELDKWKTKEIDKNGPFEQVMREFKVISVQFE